MIHLEPDLRCLQRIHEAALVAAGSFDVPLYITTQACEFLEVLLFCSLHGLGDLIDQTAHVLLHGAPCYGEDGVSSVHPRIPTPSYLRYSVSKGGMAIPTTPSRPSTAGIASAPTAYADFREPRSSE
jgi:hypothetical protein